MRWRRRREPEDPAARAEAERIAAALEGGPLGGRPVLILPVTGADAIAFGVGIEPPEVRQAWHAAREVADRLGRRPVAVAGWGGRLEADELFSRHWHDGAMPDAVLTESRGLSLEAALDRLWAGGDYLAENWAEHVDEQLALTVERVGDAPPRERARSLAPDPFALERLLFDWEEARRPTAEPEQGSHLKWFEPHDPTAVILLPDPAPEGVLAYLSFYGAQEAGGHPAFVRVLAEWNARHGAEVVASWGTMLQLAVPSPPRTLDAAFELAVEQAMVAEDTLLLPGVAVREHARALWRRGEWFLHAKP